MGIKEFCDGFCGCVRLGDALKTLVYSMHGLGHLRKPCCRLHAV